MASGTRGRPSHPRLQPKHRWPDHPYVGPTQTPRVGAPQS